MQRLPKHDRSRSDTTVTLLTLPPEIRQQIYNHTYQNVTLLLSEVFAAQHASNTLSECEACQKCRPTLPPAATLTSDSTTKQHHLNATFHTLLTCRQIYAEAREFYYANLTLHLSNSAALLPPLIRRTPEAVRANARNAVIWTHINEDTRPTTLDLLTRLPRLFPGLKTLTINNHMRPPVSYDHLVDAVYLVGPLARLAPPLNIPANNEIDPSLAPAPADPEASTSTSAPPGNPEHGLTLNLAYMKEEVMFEARFLGPISTSDSIVEHSAVIRTLFTDPDFVRAATATGPAVPALHVPPVPGAENIGAFAAMLNYDLDERLRSAASVGAGDTENAGLITDFAVQLTEMTGALLMVARRFEKPWFEKLQRRRLVEIYVEQGWDRTEAEVLADGTLNIPLHED